MTNARIKPAVEGEFAPAHTGKDILDANWFMDEIIYPADSILRGRGMETYAPVLRDDQVRACLAQRIARVTAKEWYVEPGGDTEQDRAAAADLEKNLRRLDFDSVTKLMLHGIFFGYSVAEVIWRLDGGQVAIGGVKVRDRARFMFGRDGALRLMTNAGLRGEIMPDRKFWIYSNGADHGDNPYGVGLAHWLYWPVYFKRGGMKSWLRFLDKFGAPTAKGVFPRGTSEEDKKKLLDALKAISTDAGVIIPEGMRVELIEASRGGQAEYSALYDRMNQAIAKVILTQTMTLETGSSLAQARVHQDAAHEMAKDDADTLCQSFNSSAAQWMCEWNFPGAAAPKVWRRMAAEPTTAESADLDKKIFDMGFRPTADRIQSLYGNGYEPVK
jgi:phage gp29-like protein